MLCHTLMMMAMPVSASDDRPTSVGSVDSERRPIRCHWEKSENASLCDQVIDGIEQAWTAQVETLGWPAPLPDEDGLLDVYVSSMAGGYAYTQGTGVDADPDDGKTATSAFIVFDPEFQGQFLFRYASPDSTSPKGVRIHL